MGIFDKLFKREKSKNISEEKSLEIISSKLYKCKSINEELEFINSIVDGPKFFALFDTVDDAEVITTKIPYFNREGTLTYIIPCADGCNLFTGGKISNDEALQVFNVLRDPKSHQKGTTFYDWEPPVFKEDIKDETNYPKSHKTKLENVQESNDLETNIHEMKKWRR